MGSASLFSNTTGNYNCAMGFESLKLNTIGQYNAALGYQSLHSNTIGNNNVALGFTALFGNTSGNWNTAVGYSALSFNSTGINNSAIGNVSLSANTTGSDNTSVGNGSLFFNYSGSQNTAVGSHSLSNNQTGSNNTAIGNNAGTSGSFDNTVSIGNDGWLNGASNQAFIGNASTGWIGGWVGWSIYSDARMKTKITEEVKGLDFITHLRPVTYYRSIGIARRISGNKGTAEYPEKYDVEKIQYSGFLAQEVEQAANASGYNFSGLIKPKTKNDLYSLTYETFVVPLVKAVQEQQSIIEEQNKKIEILLKEMQQIKNKLK
jgi:hypothetical protein